MPVDLISAASPGQLANSHSVIFEASSITPSSQSYDNAALPTRTLTQQELTDRFTAFSEALQSQATSLRFESPLWPLLDTLQKVMSGEPDSAIKVAMLKPSGYFSRFFSRESWEEWAEDKTELGRVIKAFVKCLEHPTKAPILFVDQFNSKLIYKANQQAKEIRRQAWQAKMQRELQKATCGTVWDCAVGAFFAPMSKTMGGLSVNIGNVQIDCYETIKYSERDVAYKKAFRHTMRETYDQMDFEYLNKYISAQDIDRAVRAHADHRAIHEVEIVRLTQARERYSPERDYFVMRNDRVPPTFTVLKQRENNCEPVIYVRPGYMYWSIHSKLTRDVSEVVGGYNCDEWGWPIVDVNSSESDIDCYRSQSRAR